MFGSIGVPEIVLIFAVALLLFGPRKLPEIGRTIGKALGEFRRASNDLKRTIEEEVATDELREVGRDLRESTSSPISLADLGGSSHPEPPAKDATPPGPDEETAVIPAAGATDGAPEAAPSDAPASEDSEPPGGSGDPEERK